MRIAIARCTDMLAAPRPLILPSRQALSVLYHPSAAFLLPMQQTLGFSQTTLTGAFSAGVLVTGAGALPAGAWLDCCGARGLMTAGSLLAAAIAAVGARRHPRQGRSSRR